MLPTTDYARRLWVCGSLALLVSCAQRETAVQHGAARNADIVLTATGRQSPIAEGQSAAFIVVVSNRGPRDAANVRIVDTVGKLSDLVSISCTPRGSATCPNPLGPAMVAESLPSGSSLEFLVTVDLASHGTGTILNSMSASLAADTDPNDNVVTNDVLVR